MSERREYWIKNDSDEWLPVEESHFHTVYASPEQFGLTRTEIDKICNECGATAGTEGPGRDMVVRRVAENGWVRVRCFGDVEPRVVVQGFKIDTQIPSVAQLIERMRDRKIIDDSGTIVLSDFATGETRNFRIGDSGVSDAVEGDLDQSPSP